ncbi:MULTISPECIES: RidA family protein [Pseudomonas]|uniref:RidA family protein n=1 Tax=Pseudomonas TaxID=286 RepID=UPI001CE45EB2|nr:MULTISPECIES: RidA family protein [Pseudomonas]MCO7595576.1 RidA family protein [Pseudomonas guariconensis]MCO7632951.1 RidA family protein [Pseudomonas guariconensis]MCU7220584.1 RidA family protein [Pseudomonas brassicacearum]
MIERINPGARASQLVIVDGRIETSGIVALAPGDIASQTRCVLAQLDDWLAQVGATKSNLTRMQIWLADMGEFKAMNEVYDAWVGDQPPVRACVGAALATPEYRIEIQAFGQR